ncbi:shikimate dehydrogenase [Henriciella aquimarina]|uniref:shikimate dehydrogenase n=1 Tax=Henriciella aquimarina TaxID=545261 RepID=UPI0009FCEDAC|nr:shikimate dehydrogenase [Henriciella aquimarina]
MTERLAVIGDPVGHSLSPQIHMTWIDTMGLKASYESIRVPAGETAAALEDFARKKFRGLNVTLPHKQAVLKSVAEMSDAVKAIGAANTLSRLKDGGWRADNTDAPGLMAALARVGIQSVSGKKVLVLGAGGAARAALYALDKAGADLVVLNRTPDKAGAVIADCCAQQHRFGPLDDLALHAEKADLMINTTSAGHTGYHFELPPGKGRTFFDMSYGAPARAQLEHAREAGWEAADGLPMLVCQAAESFRIWFGGELPDIELALEACRETLKLHG